MKTSFRTGPGFSSGIRNSLRSGESFQESHDSTELMLLCAVLANDLESMRCLLHSGAEVNAVYCDGFSALHLAADLGHTDACAMLVCHGADINLRTHSGLTPLFLASHRNGHCVRTLLDLGGDVSILNARGDTVLHAASASGLHDVIFDLIESGADVNARNSEGMTSLWMAINSGSLKSVLVLLQSGAEPKEVFGVENSSRDVCGCLSVGSLQLCQPKHQQPSVGCRQITCIATSFSDSQPTCENHRNHDSQLQNHRKQYRSVCRSLSPHLCAERQRECDQAVDPVNTQDTFMNRKSKQQQHFGHNEGCFCHYNHYLHHREMNSSPVACSQNQIFTVDHGECFPKNPSYAHGNTWKSMVASCNSLRSDYCGMTPLHRAMQLGHESIVTLLIEAGAVVNAKTKTGETPLHYAALYSSIYEGGEASSLLRQLIRSGADVDSVTSAGETPLHLASKMGDAITTGILISAGADVNRADVLGDIPLHKVCRRSVVPECNKVRTSQLLLSVGARVNAFNEEGLNPLHILLLQQDDVTDVDLLHQLINKKADVNALTRCGQHPLIIALEQGRLDFARILLEKGANPNAVSGDGTTPMHLACKIGDPCFFKVLWRKGGNPSKVDKQGCTPLLFAVEGGWERTEDLIRACIDCGTSTWQRQLNARPCDSHSSTFAINLLTSAFYRAYCNGDLPTLMLLLSSGSVSNAELHELRQLSEYRQADEVSEKQQQVISFAQRVAKVPPTLQDLCRWEISHMIGCQSNRVARACSLELPSLLTSYILFANVG